MDDLLKRMTAKQRCVLMLGTQCRLARDSRLSTALATATATRAVNARYMNDGCMFPALPGLASWSMIALPSLCCAPAPVVPRCCREHIQHSTEVHELLSKKTAKEQAKLDQYRSHGAAVLAQCEHMTKELCMQVNNAQRACPKMHKRCAGVQGARAASVRSVPGRPCTGLGAAASISSTDCGLMAWCLSAALSLS